MNESIFIRLQCDGRDIPVGALSAQGLTLDGEASATPRGYRLTLLPDTPTTVFRWNRVRQVRGWQPHEVHLSLKADGNGIVVSGIDPDSLPEGRYRLRLEIDELIPVGQPDPVEIKFAQQAGAVLQFQSDKRKFRLVTPVRHFDSRIQAVVAASSIDGMAAAEWLESEKPRAQRKACLLNILAKLRAANGTERGSFLISQVDAVFFADVDRIYATTQAGLVAHLETLAADPAKPFYREGTPRPMCTSD